ncbi:Glutathione amide reductase [Maioricimonas rarisocia]|uniref:Glutathione amide reductase n=1 Tax=Maioricimonas rarisocia TaxID=2528026 RepID=A0A517Z4X9_9PLAN|nr:NAD(P)/FAD-dependent oxidoreductase [Maioricimonas rarisocia]QDU37499.1 Glutathione amide reductase [Maioricimonas rarisocia]
MSEKYDVLLLGSGPAASRIAEAGSEAGRSVAVVDARPIGGTCALRGCNPKKVLVRAAELRDWIRRSDGELIAGDQAAINWKQLIDFKRQFTDPVTPGKKKKYAEQGIATFESPARFVGPRAVDVAGETLEAKNIVIATGARPAPLDIPGEQLLTTSDRFLESDTLPTKVVFVGGGYISFEFAHVARRAGADVTILESGDRPLEGFEPDLVDRLVEATTAVGIDVRTGHSAEAIRQESEGELTVLASSDAGNQEFSAGMVVHGGGRVPNVKSLNLEAGGIEYSNAGIRVNEFLQSVSNPDIYAAGDVVDSDLPKLTPVANRQGQTVARNLLGPERQPVEYGAVPRVAYTVPSLASIGLSENECREQGLDIDVHQGDMSDWSSVRKVGKPAAAYKVLVERKTDRLLGAHLLGPDVAETINLFALAMTYDITATRMKSVLYAFPTFASDVENML